MDDNGVAASHRDELARFLDDFQSKLSKTIISSGDAFRCYTETMQNLVKNSYQYQNQAELLEIHSRTKNESMSQVCIRVIASKL